MFPQLKKVMMMILAPTSTELLWSLQTMCSALKCQFSYSQISDFSKAMEMWLLCTCAQLLSVVSNSVQLLWTVAHQAPLSMGFSRQECWSGLPCPPPGDLSSKDPGSPALQADSLPSDPPGSPKLPPNFSIPVHPLLEASVTHWVLAFRGFCNYFVLFVFPNIFSHWSNNCFINIFPADPITTVEQFSKEQRFL